MIKIYSERLLLRDHFNDDLHSHYELLSDQEVMFYLPAIRCTSLNEARKHLALCISYSYQTPRKYYFLRVEEVFTGKHIGEAGFTVLEKTGVAGYFINKKYWNNGYASEALSALIRFAFMNTSLVKMTCGCVKQNSYSEKVMINNKMKRQRQYFTNDGVERLEYTLSIEQWQNYQSNAK